MVGGRVLCCSFGLRVFGTPRIRIVVRVGRSVRNDGGRDGALSFRLTTGPGSGSSTG